MKRQIQISHNPNLMNRNILFVVVLGVTFLILSMHMPPVSILQYPVVHVFLDVFTIVVCAMIFIIGWHSFQYNGLPFVLLIAFPFLEVGLLDLLHMLFFLGMPEWMVFGLTRKESYYWQWARLIESLSFVVALLWPRQRIRQQRFKIALFFVCILSLIVIFGIDLLGDIFFPQLYDGLNIYQLELRIGVILLHLVAMGILLLKPNLPEMLRSQHVFMFLIISIMAEFCYVLSGTPADYLYFLGHVYKVVAYGCLLQTILIYGIRSPYEQLTVSYKILENISDAVVIADCQHQVVYVNPSFTKITGYSFSDARGKTPRFLKMNKDASNMLKTLHEHGRWQGEIWDSKKSGDKFLSSMTITVVKDDQGKITHYASLFNDVTEKRELEQQIHYQAYHDPLTGLYNRHYLFQQLDVAIQADPNHSQPLAVIFVDLDRFKQINDGLGHEVGDQLLRQLAQRLLDAAEENSVVARFGGDEFVILQMGITKPEQVNVVARRILDEIERPFELDGQTYFIGGSIGISLYPWDAADRDTLIKYADLAMYKVKENGGGIAFFDKGMKESGTNRMKIETMLRKSIQEPDFHIYYQPQIASSGEIIGVEGLIRWKPEGKWISPDMFITVAEDTGLIKHLDRWVLMTACQQFLEWAPLLQPRIRLSINISSKQFQQPDFADYVKHVLQVTKMDPSLLELEITERAFIEQPKRAVSQMNALKKMGVRIAIDDFGAGYSSLLYLRNFPVDTLKIDRVFIQSLENSPPTLSIVKAILQVANDLGIEVVAEGVETERQKEILDMLRCHVLQGYLFCMPMPPEELVQWHEGRKLHQHIG